MAGGGASSRGRKKESNREGDRGIDRDQRVRARINGGKRQKGAEARRDTDMERRARDEGKEGKETASLEEGP